MYVHTIDFLLKTSIKTAFIKKPVNSIKNKNMQQISPPLHWQEHKEMVFQNILASQMWLSKYQTSASIFIPQANTRLLQEPKDGFNL